MKRGEVIATAWAFVDPKIFGKSLRPLETPVLYCGDDNKFEAIATFCFIALDSGELPGVWVYTDLGKRIFDDFDPWEGWRYKPFGTSKTLRPLDTLDVVQSFLLQTE